MNKENCALKLVDEIILYYDARSKKHETHSWCCCVGIRSMGGITLGNRICVTMFIVVKRHQDEDCINVKMRYDVNVLKYWKVTSVKA